MTSSSQLRRNIRRSSAKALAGVIFFYFVFLCACAIALGFAAGMFLVAYVLFSTQSHPVPLIAAGGMVLVGLTLIFFVFSFLTISVPGREPLNEIKVEEEAPELIQLAQNLAKEMNVRPPDRIILTEDNNAGATFTSSFWSLFFPPGQDLVLGLGLINAMTVSEIRAVIVHEFGHFSQPGLRVYSFVHQANTVIYNLFYNQNGIQRWVEKHTTGLGCLNIFGIMASAVISGLKDLLIATSKLTLKPFFQLSRDMEFHADEMAARTSGSEPFASALLRNPIISQAWEDTLAFNRYLAAQHLKSINIYPQIRYFMEETALQNQLKFQNGLPVIPLETYSSWDCGKVKVYQQWASHPPKQERVKRVQALNFPAKLPDTRPAWELFSDPQKIQQESTRFFLIAVRFTGSFTPLYPDQNKEKAQEYLKKGNIPTIFRAFFMGFPLADLDASLIFQEHEVPENLESIINGESLGWGRKLACLRADVELLSAIRAKDSGVRTFHYEGNRTQAGKAGQLIKKLKKEIQETESNLKIYHLKLHKFFIKNAREAGKLDKWKEMLDEYHQVHIQEEANAQLQFEMHKGIQFMSQDLPSQEIYQHIDHLRPGEDAFRQVLKKMLELETFRENLSAEWLHMMKLFISNEQPYFSRGAFNSTAVVRVSELVQYFGELRELYFFSYFQTLLQFQAGILETQPD